MDSKRLSDSSAVDSLSTHAAKLAMESAMAPEVVSEALAMARVRTAPTID